MSGAMLNSLSILKTPEIFDTNTTRLSSNLKINYSDLQGEIATKTALAVNSNNMATQISKACYDAVVNGLSNANISVDINATTEEGVILNKAVNGINEYITKTGSLPFPVPIN